MSIICLTLTFDIDSLTLWTKTDSGARERVPVYVLFGG